MAEKLVRALALFAGLTWVGCGTGVITETGASVGDPNGTGGDQPGGAAGAGGTAGVQAGEMGGSSGGGASGGGTSGGTGGRMGGAGGAMGGAGGAMSGTGGILGTGGMDGPPPPHMVGACNGLGNVDQVQDITPPGVDRKLNDGILSVAADPVNTGTIYVGTGKQGLWKSTDCGSTWAKINKGMKAKEIETGLLWVLLLDPIEPTTMYLGSLYGGDLSLLKSTNGGVDWFSTWPAGSEISNSVDLGGYFQELSIDPTNHKHLVVSFHSNCKGAIGAGCLGESMDGGGTWRLVKGPLPGWSENARPLVLGPTNWLLATWADGLFQTTDGAASWKKVGAGGGRYYRAKDGTYYLANYQGVLKSTDGRAWSMVMGSMPGSDIVGDGDRMFVSYYWWMQKQPLFAGSELTGLSWKNIATPNLDHGASTLAYDADHHALYMAMPTGGGLFRMKTK